MQFNFARFTCIYYIYDRNFALHYPKRSESIRVLGTDRRSVMMIRVKVNSKSELVEDREGKSSLYGVICCCGDRLLLRAVICGLDLRSIKLTVVKVVVSSEGYCGYRAEYKQVLVIFGKKGAYVVD